MLTYVTCSPRKADILLDSTCFSSADFDNLSDSDADSDSYDPHGRLFNFFSTMTEIANSKADTQRRMSLCNNSLDNRARYTHPTLPLPSLYSTLSQPMRFIDYIKNMFPSIKPVSDSSTISESTELKDTTYKEVNATAANTLLNTGIPVMIAESDWIKGCIFPDSILPVAFNEGCLNDVPDCWDATTCEFVNFPATTTEFTLQDWLNHLAHVLGVKHKLIKPIPPEEPSPEELSLEEPLTGPEEHLGLSEELVSDDMYASDGKQENDGKQEDDGEQEDDEDHDAEIGGQNAGIVLGDVIPDIEKRNGYVVPEAKDRSFSQISHNNPPTGGYRTRKPNIILLNQSLRHFLHENDYRPHWHHI